MTRLKGHPAVPKHLSFQRLMKHVRLTVRKKKNENSDIIYFRKFSLRTNQYKNSLIIKYDTLLILLRLVRATINNDARYELNPSCMSSDDDAS